MCKLNIKNIIPIKYNLLRNNQEKGASYLNRLFVVRKMTEKKDSINKNEI